MILRRVFCTFGNFSKQNSRQSIQGPPTSEADAKREKLFYFLVSRLGYFDAAEIISANRETLLSFIGFLALKRSRYKAAQVAADFGVESLLPADLRRALPRPKRPLYRKPDSFSSSIHSKRKGDNTKELLQLSRLGFEPGRNVHFIGTNSEEETLDAACVHLQTLLESSQGAFAFDSEASFAIGEFSSRLAILQVATTSAIFVIDMTNIDPNHRLCRTLAELFEARNVRKLCAGVSSTELRSIASPLRLRAANNLLDVQKLFKRVSPFTIKSNLGYMTATLLNLRLCKAEQISNWLRRPLRLSQLHYAAADAFVLHALFAQMEKRVRKSEVFSSLVASLSKDYPLSH